MPCCFALFCLENGSNGCVFKVLNIMYHVCIIDLASIIYGKVELSMEGLTLSNKFMQSAVHFVCMHEQRDSNFEHSVYSWVKYVFGLYKYLKFYF
jgi:hypothetical protein